MEGMESVLGFPRPSSLCQLVWHKAFLQHSHSLSTEAGKEKESNKPSSAKFCLSEHQQNTDGPFSEWRPFSTWKTLSWEERPEGKREKYVCTDTLLCKLSCTPLISSKCSWTQQYCVPSKCSCQTEEGTSLCKERNTLHWLKKKKKVPVRAFKIEEKVVNSVNKAGWHLPLCQNRFEGIGMKAGGDQSRFQDGSSKSSTSVSSIPKGRASGTPTHLQMVPWKMNPCRVLKHKPRTNELQLRSETHPDSLTAFTKQVHRLVCQCSHTSRLIDSPPNAAKHPVSYRPTGNDFMFSSAEKNLVQAVPYLCKDIGYIPTPSSSRSELDKLVTQEGTGMGDCRSIPQTAWRPLKIWASKWGKLPFELL